MEDVPATLPLTMRYAFLIVHPFHNLLYLSESDETPSAVIIHSIRRSLCRTGRLVRADCTIWTCSSRAEFGWALL